jgi:hypothetical protein
MIWQMSDGDLGGAPPKLRAAAPARNLVARLSLVNTLSLHLSRWPAIVALLFPWSSGLVPATFAQAPVYQWATTLGTPEDDDGFPGVASDGSGNTFLCVVFAGSIAVGATNLVSNGTNDLWGGQGYNVALAKYDPSGQVAWALRLGSRAGVDNPDLTVDATGNVLVIGNFEGTLELPGTNLVNEAARDTFLAKFDPNGELLWARQSPADAWDVAVNSNGDSYVAGVVWGSGAFAARFDAAGNTLWQRQIGTGWAWASAVAVGLQGTVYLAGEILCSPDGLPGAQCTSLAKLAADGTTVWMRHVATAMSHERNDRAIAVDTSGSVYVADSFAGLATFDGVVLTNAYESGEDVYVAKYDADGRPLWVRQFGGPGNQHSYDVAVAPAGGVYVCGSFWEGNADSGFLLRYGSDGDLLWAHRESGNGSVYFLRLAALPSAILYASGKFVAPMQLGSTVLRGFGGKDIFLTRMDLGSEVARPVLTIGVKNDQVALRWPVWAVGYELESTVDVSPSGIWKGVDAPPVVESGGIVLTNNMTGLERFYRLRKR